MKTTIYIKRERRFGFATSQFTPIELELPEDDEIIDKRLYPNQISQAQTWKNIGFIRGAKWLRDKIKSQLK